MDRFDQKTIAIVVTVLSLVFTTVGTAYALISHLDWLLQTLCLSLFLIAISTYLLCRNQLTAATASLKQENEKRLNLEQRLNEVGVDVVDVLRDEFSVSARSRTMQELSAYLNGITRDSELRSVISRLSVRRFVFDGQDLFVVVRVPAVASRQLHENDVLLLVRQVSGGPETQIAEVELHQPPDFDRETAFFRVVDAKHSVLSSLKALASCSEVTGLRDYWLRPRSVPHEFQDSDLRAGRAFFDKLLNLMAKEGANS
ncbi:MAG: hypothetical protein ABSD63_05055 [Candidatus Korobacteraceae bacterium]|jgi:hypothetical protein